MDAIHLHLVVVHIPIIGLLFTILLLMCAHITKEEILFKVSYFFLIVCAFFAIIAYLSGPLAYEKQPDLETTYVENHAILGKTCFVGILILAVVALSALSSYIQGDKPSSVHRYAILLTALILLYFFAWTAHVGASIHHEHIRGANTFGIFPSGK